MEDKQKEFIKEAYDLFFELCGDKTLAVNYAFAAYTTNLQTDRLKGD